MLISKENQKYNILIINYLNKQNLKKTNNHLLNDLRNCY